MRVVIVEDAVLLRAGLTRLLADEGRNSGRLFLVGDLHLGFSFDKLLMVPRAQKAKHSQPKPHKGSGPR